jgi:UDP-GlcNAc:undecaprenyl-phosphate GlcNAc-1-phosphate transferase
MPIDILYLILAAFAFVLALITVPLADRFGRRFGFVDAVRPDKIHEKPVVRCGGVGIYMAFMLGLGVCLLGMRWGGELPFVPESIRAITGNLPLVGQRLVALLAGATILFATGLVDDRTPLRPLVKLALQILSAIPLLMAGIYINLFLEVEWLGMLITVFWVVLLTNAFNLLDNMNGLSCGVACVCTLNFYLISRANGELFMMGMFALLFGSMAGFLRFNFPRARLFMGDSGSLFIGYMLAALSIMVTYYKVGIPTQLPVIAPLLILGVPLFDTASVMYIRWRNGAPLMQGDQNHFSHRLVALGFSRTGAVVFIWAVALQVGLGAVLLRWLPLMGAVIALAQALLFFLSLFLLETIGRSRRP